MTLVQLQIIGVVTTSETPDILKLIYPGMTYKLVYSEECAMRIAIRICPRYTQ